MIQVISSNGTQYNTGRIFIFDKYGKLKAPSGGSASWGTITGTLSSQTDLQNALNAKQDTLVSGTNIKTINSNPILGSGDLSIHDLPTGGTDGQLLAKNSATNYDVTWIDNYTSSVQHTVKLAESINKGQAVYVSSANGTNMLVSKASNASEATSSKTMGLLAFTGITNDQGFVVTEGLLAGLDTSSANAAGDPVWLGTSGNLLYGLANKPYAPQHLVFIGIVTRKQSNNGEIFVKVQNGFELKEIHDVQAQSPALKDTLYYDTTDSQWKTASIATILGYTPQPSPIYVKDSTTYTSTATTAGQILKSILIPANTFVAGDVLRVTARFKKTGTNNSANQSLGINSVLSVSGATTFKTNSITTSSPAFGIFAHAVIINATSNTQLPWPATNYGTSDIVAATAVAAGSWQENVAINWTINQYIIFQTNLNSTLDSVSLIFYMIEKL